MAYGEYDRYARGGDNPWRLDIDRLDMPKAQPERRRPKPPPKPEAAAPRAAAPTPPPASAPPGPAPVDPDRVVRPPVMPDLPPLPDVGPHPYATQNPYQGRFGRGAIRPDPVGPPLPATIAPTGAMPPMTALDTPPDAQPFNPIRRRMPLSRPIPQTPAPGGEPSSDFINWVRNLFSGLDPMGGAGD